MDTLNEAIINALGKALRVPPESLSKNMKLASLPNWDSMAQLEIIWILDSSYDVALPLGAIASACTVGDLIRLSQSHIGGAGTELEALVSH